VICLLAGFHREAPAPAARPWLRVGAVGAGLALCSMAVRYLVPTCRLDGTFCVDSPWSITLLADLWSLRGWAVIVGGAVYLLARSQARHDRSGSLALALAVCAASVLPERCYYGLAMAFQSEYLVTVGTVPSSTVVAVATLAQVAVIAIIGMVTLTLGIRRVLRLSAPAAPRGVS